MNPIQVSSQNLGSKTIWGHAESEFCSFDIQQSRDGCVIAMQGTWHQCTPSQSCTKSCSGAATRFRVRTPHTMSVLDGALSSMARPAPNRFFAPQSVRRPLLMPGQPRVNPGSLYRCDKSD